MTDSRRSFLKKTLAGSAALGSALAHAPGSVASSLPAMEEWVPQVKRRRLGRIDREVGILGLGLGSAFTGPNRDDPVEVSGLLGLALKHGINYFDTARAYGPSEAMIGPFVEKNRNRIFLVSKSGARTADGLKRDLETTLNNLKTDHLDLYHMHNLDPRRDDLDAMHAGCYQAILQAKEQGVIKHFGVTGHSGAQILIDAIHRFEPDAVLTTFPVTRPDAGRYEDQLLPLAREKNMAVIAMKALRHARDADLKGTDLIRYPLSLDGVHTTIVGLDTFGHLQQNIAMATSFEPLDTAQRQAMHEHAALKLAAHPAPWDHPTYQDIA